MADAPWRCSECGTVNEPVANACRTCGRWPSLFELEGSTIETDMPREAEQSAELYEPDVVYIDDLGPDVYDLGEAPEVDDDLGDEQAAPPKPPWRRLGRLIVPIGVVLYLLISALANRGG